MNQISFTILRNPNQATLPYPYEGSWSRDVEITFDEWDPKSYLAKVFVGGQLADDPITIPKHEVPKTIVQAATMFPRWFDTGYWF